MTFTFAYRRYPGSPSRGESGLIYRPSIPLSVSGPKGTAVVMGLLDTGSDLTLLPSFILGVTGAKYLADESVRIRGVGGQVVTAHYSKLELALNKGKRQCRWPAKVAFLEDREVAILGYHGVLEFFHTTFDTEQHRVRLQTNGRFSGLRS